MRFFLKSSEFTEVLRALLIPLGVLPLASVEDAFIHLIYLCVCACVNLCARHGCRCLQRPEEGFKSLGIGVTGNCKPPDAGN